MNSVALVIHPARPTAIEAARVLQDLLTEHGVKVAEADGSADAVVSLGGDGTTLRAAGIALRMDVPLLGVNLGNLGFLSSVDVSQLSLVVEALKGDRFELEERMMLDAAVTGAGADPLRVVALNEVLVERGTSPRVVAIKVSVGSEQVAVYEADGFIVATPTGSTAYSLSAGGPVVEPTVEAMVLTSVSAHAPLWRSIVVGPHLEVTLEMPVDATAFSADGQQVTMLPAGSKVVVRRNERPLRLIGIGPNAFYRKLRSRFRVEPMSVEIENIDDA